MNLDIYNPVKRQDHLYKMAAVYIHNVSVKDGCYIEYGYASSGTPFPVRFAEVPIAPYSTTNGRTVVVTEDQLNEYLQAVANYKKPHARWVGPIQKMLTS